MIATIPEMRALTHDLTVSMWTLSAIGVLFESGLAENLREPRFGIARENVARAKLEGRIELRKAAIEDLCDDSSFDVAWLPAFFLGAAAVKGAAARVLASLRPGGWVLLPVLGAAGDERQKAVWAMVCDLWGGPALSLADAEALLKEAGFSSVRAMAGPPWAPALVVGQR